MNPITKADIARYNSMQRKMKTVQKLKRLILATSGHEKEVHGARLEKLLERYNK